MVSRICSKNNGLSIAANRTSVFVVFKLCTALFYGITHVMEHKDRESRHVLSLFLIERLVEWLPRLGELIQIG